MIQRRRAKAKHSSSGFPPRISHCSLLFFSCLFVCFLFCYSRTFGGPGAHTGLVAQHAPRPYTPGSVMSNGSARPLTSVSNVSYASSSSRVSQAPEDSGDNDNAAKSNSRPPTTSSVRSNYSDSGSSRASRLDALQAQLERERLEREKLQKEVEELKEQLSMSGSPRSRRGGGK